MLNPAPAHPSDLPEVVSLLAATKLPNRDLSPEAMRHFLTLRQRDRLLGVVGLEVYGGAGLLRSLAVAEEARGTGLGSRLVETLETHARGVGVETLYLLTTTAEAFFAARGYEVVPRERVPPRLAASPEFASLCPASAVCMRKPLADA